MPKNFASLQRDDNNQVIPAGGNIATQDATGTPQTSPLAITTGVTTIAVPENAAEIVMTAAEAFRVSEIVSMARYFTAASNVIMAFPVSRTDNIYVRADSTGTSLHFFFLTV